MYRISKLAELLGVSTVQIHEKLISGKEALSPYIDKQSGVTLLSEQGLLVLKRLFDAENREPIAETLRDSQPECPTPGQGAPVSEMTLWDQRELELLDIKDRLNQGRGELHRLNLEGRKLDDAISHYLNILQDDFDKRIRQEDQIEGAMRFQSNSE